VLMAVQCFFLLLVSFITTPFDVLAQGKGIVDVGDGQGLNPLKKSLPPRYGVASRLAKACHAVAACSAPGAYPRGNVWSFPYRNGGGHVYVTQTRDYLVEFSVWP